MKFVVRSTYTLYNLVNYVDVSPCESALVQGDSAAAQPVYGAVSILAKMIFIQDCFPPKLKVILGRECVHETIEQERNSSFREIEDNTFSINLLLITKPNLVCQDVFYVLLVSLNKL